MDTIPCITIYASWAAREPIENHSSTIWHWCGPTKSKSSTLLSSSSKIENDQWHQRKSTPISVRRSQNVMFYQAATTTNNNSLFHIDLKKKSNRQTQIKSTNKLAFEPN